MDREKLIAEFEKFINEVFHTDRNQIMLEQVLELLKEKGATSQ